MFSATVVGRMIGCCKTRPIWARRSSRRSSRTSTPSSSTAPCAGSKNRGNRFNKVVLPEPLEELCDIREEDEQLAQGQLRGQHFLSADPRHPERARSEDHGDRAPVEDLQTLLRHLLLPRGLGLSGEAQLLVLFARVALDQR